MKHFFIALCFSVSLFVLCFLSWFQIPTRQNNLPNPAQAVKIAKGKTITHSKAVTFVYYGNTLYSV